MTACSLSRLLLAFVLLQLPLALYLFSNVHFAVPEPAAGSATRYSREELSALSKEELIALLEKGSAYYLACTPHDREVRAAPVPTLMSRWSRK